MRHCFIAVAAVALPMLVTPAAASDRTLITDPEFQSFLATFEEGTRRFMNGDTALWKSNVSRRDDVMIMGAWGAFEKGWPDVSARYDWAGARFNDSGASLKVEYLAGSVSGELAYTTAIERAEVKIVGQDKPAPMSLRVTHVFRKEDGGWKLMLRHADPLMTKTAPDAVLKK
jgi:ketosteroid isomerase-like protein